MKRNLIPKDITYAETYSKALKRARVIYNERTNFTVVNVKYDKSSPTKNHPKMVRWNIILKLRER